MTGALCPSCGVEDVCSRREWVAVYDYRHSIRDDPRGLARALAEYGVEPRPGETAAYLCRRWAEEGVEGGPELICAYCRTPFSRLEVSR